MKTTSLNFIKLVAFALLVIFSACTESEDPVPTTPDNQNPTPGLPDLGGLGNGPTTPGGGTTNPGGGTTNPGGQNTQSVGSITTSNGGYDFPYYLTAEATSQPNAAGAYPIEYYYADEAAAQDQDGDDNVEGVISVVAFNAASAGTVQPGQYAYTLGSENPNVFSYIMVIDRGRIYVVAEAQSRIDATSSNDVYQVVFDGRGVEIEIVGEQVNVIGNPFDMEGQFLIPATTTTSSFARVETSKSTLPQIYVDFSKISF